MFSKFVTIVSGLAVVATCLVIPVMSARDEFGLFPGGLPKEGPPIVTVVLDESLVGQTVTQAVVVDGAQAAWALIVRNERRTGTARNARIAMIAIMTGADLSLIAPAAVPPDGRTLVSLKRFIAFLLT
jgi:hypothetical protein